MKYPVQGVPCSLHGQKSKNFNKFYWIKKESTYILYNFATFFLKFSKKSQECHREEGEKGRFVCWIDKSRNMSYNAEG